MVYTWGVNGSKIMYNNFIISFHPSVTELLLKQFTVSLNKNSMVNNESGTFLEACPIIFGFHKLRTVDYMCLGCIL